MLNSYMDLDLPLYGLIRLLPAMVQRHATTTLINANCKAHHSPHPLTSLYAVRGPTCRSLPAVVKRQAATTLLDLVTKSRPNMEAMAQHPRLRAVFRDHVAACGDYATQVGHMGAGIT